MKKSGKIQGIEKIICSATAPFWFMENNTQNRKLMVVAVQTVLKQANLKDVEVKLYYTVGEAELSLSLKTLVANF